MSLLKQKRFWKAAAVVERDGGFGVALDARAVNTPNKTPLILPTRIMAEAIAVEWDAQVDKIDPLTMPVTRGANSAIDKVAPQQAEVVADLANYGDSDLLCYRAAGPVELVDATGREVGPCTGLGRGYLWHTSQCWRRCYARAARRRTASESARGSCRI